MSPAFLTIWFNICGSHEIRVQASPGTAIHGTAIHGSIF
jgi:hypothetical protein